MPCRGICLSHMVIQFGHERNRWCADSTVIMPCRHKALEIGENDNMKTSIKQKYLTKTGTKIQFVEENMVQNEISTAV